MYCFVLYKLLTLQYFKTLTDKDYERSRILQLINSGRTKKISI